MYERSMYGDAYGASAANVTEDTAKVVGAGVSAAAGSSAVSALLVGSASAATVPVAGWVVAGVLAATAATVALVASVKQRKVQQKEAIKAAKAMKLPDPEKVPGFIVKALDLSSSKRAKLISKYAKHLDKLRDKKGVFPKHHQKRVTKLAAKLKILKAIDIVEKGQANKYLPKNVQTALSAAPKVPASQAPVADAAAEQEIQADMADKGDEGGLPSIFSPSSASPATASTIPTWVWPVSLLIVVGGAYALSQRGGGAKK